MVLGLRSRHKKGASVQVDYIVEVDEIKPWPPSQSLRSVQSVQLLWENGGHNSGSLVSNVGDTHIEFKESFMLSLTLSREKKSQEKFQKNFLEFYLYEPRKDKMIRGQPLGTATINLADFGVIEEIISISTPVNCRKTFKSSEQPALFVKIQPIHKDSSNSSPHVSLSKETSIEKDGQLSAAVSVNEENEDECEIASFTDDDVSSHSSQNIAFSTSEAARASPSQQGKRDDAEPDLPLELDSAALSLDSTSRDPRNPDRNTTTELSSSSSLSREDSTNTITSLPKLSDRSMTSVQKVSAPPVTGSISSSSSLPKDSGRNGQSSKFDDKETTTYDFQEHIANKKALAKKSIRLAVEKGSTHRSSIDHSNLSIKDNFGHFNDHYQELQDKILVHAESTVPNDLHVNVVGGTYMKEHPEIEQHALLLEEIPQNKLNDKSFPEISRKQSTFRSDTLNSSKELRLQGSSVTNGKLKHMKSLQFIDLANRTGFPGSSQNLEEAAKTHVIEDARSNGKGNKSTNGFPDPNNEWKSRIETLEEELREAAAIEVSLYAVIAEHGSSVHKVHAPARRLSRFYAHACGAQSQAKQASAARAAVSGLVLVSKACGTDVPRLTYWLSNSIMLRAIISQAASGRRLSDEPYADSSSAKISLDGRSLKKINEFSSNNDLKNSLTVELDWEDTETFTLALEQVEAWIFSRIIESVWWQSLTPHMQSAAASGRSVSFNAKKNYSSRCGLRDQEQGNLSIELWKKAFKDACERLCPIRAGGHECGCLPLLARSVMEHLVSRLDVAMFNAILRESAEEMPTDPVSDPISDSKVLPIPAGKSSFGAGVQLKNAIGNWSIWLSNLFGIEENDSSGDSNNLADDKAPGPSKPFHLLNALSDLMMLPFEMLADPKTRKEVCPIIGPILIKRVLDGFVPDEFCPDAVPRKIIQALDSQDVEDSPEEVVSSIPCTASTSAYMPPSVESVLVFMGDTGNQYLQRSESSVLKKSYTSDDELDELDSPLTSIIAPNLAKLNWMIKGKGDHKVVRYQLLRQVWRGDEQ